MVTALLLVLIAPFGAAGAEEHPAGTAPDLGGITVRSGRFPSGTVTLRNGEYRGPAAHGSGVQMVVKLTDRRAFGTVNGREAAAVVIVTDPGGSGTFSDLALLLTGDRGWVNVDTVPLGDRVKVHSIGIGDNAVTVRMTAHGPGDALCCPTRDVMRRFTFQAEHLVAEPDAGPGQQEIVGPAWKWVKTLYRDDTALAPPASAPGYTLQMKQDGTVQVRGDCNRGGGTFNLNGRSLAVTITHTTRAACPEGSLEDAFIRDLNKTGGWLLKNGSLLLDLKYDSGTMEFRESGTGTR
jgi:heat shock protein HslJ